MKTYKIIDEFEDIINEIEYTAHYKKYIKEHSKSIDWKNRNQYKYYLQFNFHSNEISVGLANGWKSQGVIYASSEKIIFDAVKTIGEDNIKKYVLGVR